MDKTFKHVTTPHILLIIDSLERKELAAIAKTIGVPVGKSRFNTVASISTAIAKGKLQVKSVVTITLPSKVSRHGPVVFSKKFRSYRPDKVLVPVTVAKSPGSDLPIPEQD